jgi:hypothetical protein
VSDRTPERLEKRFVESGLGAAAIYPVPKDDEYVRNGVAGIFSFCRKAPAADLPDQKNFICSVFCGHHAHDAFSLGRRARISAAGRCRAPGRI